MDISGLSAMITGGASGLGQAVAVCLADAGAHVTIVDVEADAGERVAEEIGCIFVRANVTSEPEVDRAFDQAEAAYGPTRILINCAGIAPCLHLTRSEGAHRLDAFRYTMDVNVSGTFLTCSRFAHRLRGAEALGEETGVIINTSSIVAYDGHVGHAAYAASKAAVAGMTLPMARELAAMCIRVVCIAPGMFDTPMLENLPGRDRVPIATQVPHPARLGRPEEFAGLVKHIIENPMMNGEVVRVDGAFRLGPR